ncbi:hypothetical protein SCRDD08_01034 [Streptococcus cristatus]|uniref:Uncharacterized protein n=1 Tax=Streptococcus cristatus TaxID=45634 RepID=A0A139N286_STRCR|nr:hypothetical protein SCRDD08_01034 [Streptococcus cristatus]
MQVLPMESSSKARSNKLVEGVVWMWLDTVNTWLKCHGFLA